jgi:hypothetical protein
MGRLEDIWREVSITVVGWNEGENVKWVKYQVKNDQTVEKIVAFYLNIVRPAERIAVAKEILQRNRRFNPRAWKGKAIDSPLPAGWQIQVPDAGIPPQVTALADTGQFTVTGGYAKINVVEVPRRRGISVFAGYDPITATLPVLLLDMPYGTPSAEQEPIVERQCRILEWMGGRGRPTARVRPTASQGKAPYAVMVSTEGEGNEPTFLVPQSFNAASVAAEVCEWYITGIQWGDSVRDREGKRRKQHLVLTLTENSPLEGANEASTGHPRGRPPKKQHQKGG